MSVRRRIPAALAENSALGSFFEVRPGPGEPLSGLAQAPLLDSLVAATAKRIGTDEPRVAASLLQYGIVERFWSVALGSWAVDGVIPDFDGLRFTVSDAHRIEFRAPARTEWDCWDCRDWTPEQVGALLVDTVVERRLTEVHHGIRTCTRVAEGLLWGNAATSLTLSVRAISRFHPADRVCAVASWLLDRPPLARRVDGPVLGPIRRRTCCLYYRSRARKTCGDCPLTGSVAAPGTPASGRSR